MNSELDTAPVGDDNPEEHTNKKEDKDKDDNAVAERKCAAAVLADDAGDEPIDIEKGWDENKERDGGVDHLLGVTPKDPKDCERNGAGEDKGDDEGPDEILQERGRKEGRGEGIRGREDAGGGIAVENKGGDTGGGRVPAG